MSGELDRAIREANEALVRSWQVMVENAMKHARDLEELHSVRAEQQLSGFNRARQSRRNDLAAYAAMKALNKLPVAARRRASILRLLCPDGCQLAVVYPRKLDGRDNILIVATTERRQRATFLYGPSELSEPHVGCRHGEAWFPPDTITGAPRGRSKVRRITDLPGVSWTQKRRRGP